MIRVRLGDQEGIKIIKGLVHTLETEYFRMRNGGDPKGFSNKSTMDQESDLIQFDSI